MESSQLNYKNWNILVTPIGKRWQFHAASIFSPVEEDKILSDGCTYVERTVAYQAAKAFVDGVMIRSEMAAYFDSLQEQGKLTGGDLRQINKWLSRLSTVEIEFRSEVAQLPLRQPPGIPSDSTDEYPA